MTSDQHIVITGFMGCGKTEVASLLAARLKRPMVDLDHEITRLHGHTPADLIVNSGEQAFRAIETNVLLSVLKGSSGAVIALGGGAWIQELNRELIIQVKALTVWLDVPFDVCWKRISHSHEDRPLGRTPDQARELFDRRRPIYGLAAINVRVRPREEVSSVAKRVELAVAQGSTAA